MRTSHCLTSHCKFFRASRRTGRSLISREQSRRSCHVRSSRHFDRRRAGEGCGAGQGDGGALPRVRRRMRAASSSRCSRARSTPTNCACSNAGPRPRLSPRTPSSTRAARRSRKGSALALASARITSTIGPAETPQGGSRMKVSFFETGRYAAPPICRASGPSRPARTTPRPASRPTPRLSSGSNSSRSWASTGSAVSEHHYSPRILTPSPVVSAAFIAAHVDKIKIALLGSDRADQQPDPRRRGIGDARHHGAGRMVAGMLRGTTNEYLSYDLNPKEARERTDEGMELILKAWTEPQPFGWQGSYFQYRTVSLWPRPQSSRIRRPMRSAPAPKPASSPRATISGSASPTARSS